jgi:DNA-binding beta-propeller fold protein YncE
MRTLLIFLLSLSIDIFPYEIINLERGFNLGQKMEENGVYVKSFHSLDFDGSYIYIPDYRYGTIIKADIKTGKLVKTISSKGQGPAELERPECLVVKNGKIYVYNGGYGGIKIFDKEGEYINSFRTLSSISPFILSTIFDVNEKEEIFVAAHDFKDNKLVTIYDGKTGRKISSIISGNIPTNDVIEFKKSIYSIRVDKEDNIYLLYPLKNLIKKYNRKGELIWEKEVEDELIKSAPHNYLYSFDVNENGFVFIAYHKGKGGCIIDKNGKTCLLFKGIVESPFIRVKNNRIVYSAPFLHFLFMTNTPSEIEKYFK